MFNPEAILYSCIRGYTYKEGKIFFRMSCLFFEKRKLFTGNPPSHSLECNKVFIVCQDYYYKNDIKTLVYLAVCTFSTISSLCTGLFVPFYPCVPLVLFVVYFPKKNEVYFMSRSFVDEFNYSQSFCLNLSYIRKRFDLLVMIISVY